MSSVPSDSSPTLLLTGATGFLGYYLSHTLAARGRSFRALVRPGADVRYLRELGDRCELVKGDLLDPDSLLTVLRGVDTVVHAAAAVSFQPGDDARLRATNVDGTAYLVNAMLAAGCRRLVYVSSVAALDRVSGGPVVTVADRTPIHPANSPYALSKQLAEREVWRGQAEGLNVAVAYPSIILGAGDWSGHNTPALWRQVAAGMPVYPGGAAGFVDVRDVASALCWLLDRNRDGDRYLLNAGNLSWREVLTHIAHSIDAAPPRWALPGWLATGVAPLLEIYARWRGRRPVLTRQSARNARAVHRYDGEPYATASGAAYTDLEQTIRETGQAFRTARQLGKLPTLHLPLRDVAQA